MRIVQISQQARCRASLIWLPALLLLLSGCGQTLEITPTQAQVAAGTTLQLAAATLHSLVSTDVTSQVSWSSSNTAVATVSSAGVVSAVSAGSVTISASFSGSDASMSLTVTPGALVSIQVTPANPSLPAGLTEPFIATGVFSDNSTEDLTQQVTWASSSPTVASVSNTAGTAGLASAASPGSTTITAASGSISGSATLTVTSATLVSIQVTPANPSTPKGVSQQFTATGVFSDNSTQNLTTQVTWASSSASVATISNASGSQGVANTLAAGSTTISATSGAISGSTTLTVTSATLVSIAITPASPSIATGLTKQFTATGTYSDNSTQNLSAQVIWVSSNTGVATISNAAGTQGLASSVTAGSTTITATSGSISGSTALTVTSATLVSIAVTPASPSIATGLTKQFTATGTYTDNSTQNLSAQVTWASSNTSVATISNAAGTQGLASSVTAGSTTITATSGSISGSTGLAVTSVTLVSIALTPANTSIANGLTQQFTATGTYTDNSTQNLTTQVTWSSSNTSVATISNAAGTQGLASSVTAGSTTITATSGSISGSTGLTVTSATLVSIAVTPANASIPNGLTKQFTATGTYTDNSTQNLTAQVTWSSSNLSAATISNAVGSQGLASSASAGSTTITAINGSISGSTGMTVTSATLVSITVTPANSSIPNGQTLQFTATGTYTDASTQNITTQVTWSTNNSSIATISNAAGSQGLASSVALGSNTISATSGIISGSTGLTVSTCANGYTNCEMVSIDHTQVGNSDSSNFPMLFSGKYSYLATVANGGSVQNTVTQQGITVPADAVFTADAGCTTTLNWEVQSYDATTGAVIIWVQIPTLSHTSDTVIYLCVGKSSISTFQGGSSGAAWDGNYQGVWHLGNGTTLSASDSTSNANNGTINQATAISGPLGGGASFSGNPDYISIASNSGLQPEYLTLSAWINPSSSDQPNAYARYIQKGTDSNAPTFGSYFVQANVNSSTSLVPLIGFSDGDTAGTALTMTADVWSYLVMTYDGSNVKFYLNGVLESTSGISQSITYDNLPLVFGAASNTAGNGYQDYAVAELDEIRVSSIARSADWVTAEYNNQASPSTFYTVGN